MRHTVSIYPGSEVYRIEKGSSLRDFAKELENRRCNNQRLAVANLGGLPGPNAESSGRRISI